MATVSLLLILSLSLLLTNGDGTDEITVEVDPQNGNDDSCLSVRELIDSNQTESPFPCKTLNYALNGNETSYYTTGNCSMSDIQYSNIFIVLMDGVHRLVSQLQLVGATNVHILADNSRKAVIECVEFPNYAVDNFDNFFACNVDGLEFKGVVFERCGPVSSNVFVYNCSNVVFESCTFNGNTGAPLQLRFVDDLLVENTIFEHNKNNGTAQSDNNETSITDLYNIIQTSGGLTFFGGKQNVTVHIENCTFLSNEASKNELRETRPVLLKQNGHGAAMLIRLSGTYLSSFEIVNCKFIDNYAEVDGGAIYISYSDKSRNNSFNIEKTLFEENSVLIAAGGAVSINSFNLSYSNIFTFQDCQFLQNSANAGGGVSMALYDRDLLSAENPDKIFFDKCRFIDNKAINEGTAVGLFSLVHVDQVGFPVYFENCHFENNTSEELSTNGSSDTSAVASFRFPTIFEGTNIFINNTGGGIMLLNTRMQASGVMLFEGNSAVFGGGIMMDDRCLLEVQPHLNMTFSNNVASESGGGIYVDFPPIRFIIDIFNRLCFLQYNDGSGEDEPPQDWEDVTISFINNTARLSGAAIYASDMQRCAWLGNDNVDNISDPLIFRMPSFLGRSPFYYEGNTLMVENTNTIKDPELATAPLRIHPSVNILNNLVQPGEILSITLYATDQVNNTREAVWSLSSPGVNTTLDALSANNDTYFYNVPSISENNASITLTFSLLKTLGFNNSLTLTVRLCHPGYVNLSNHCVCEDSNSHIRRCDDENRYVYLREGIWGGVHPDTGKLVTAGVLPGYIVCEQQGRLPGCLFKFDDPDAQCKSGRKGTLCGECTSGYSVTLDLQTCSPDDCVIGLVLFILFSCILLFVVCFVILFFNIPLPNELKAFIFYVQVIGLVYRPFSVVNTQSASIDPVAVIVNLLGFSVPIPFCIFNGNSAQYIALLGYIPPLILITNVLFFVVGARFIKPLAHHSAIKGITTLFYFFYKYIADTSFVFLSCVKTDLGFVFQYDASTHCFSPYFGFFFVVGLLIVVFFVAPIPFCVAYSSKFRRPIKFQPYADVLTDGLKCKFLWWPGWDIGRRLPFVLISFFVVLERPSLILFFMCLAAMIVLIVQVICKPYENEVINIIEALVALNLVLVVAVFLDPSSEQLPRYVGIILLFLPYIYCFVYIGYRIGKYGMEKFKEHKQMMSSENTPSVHGNDEAGEGEGEESGGGEGEESRGREHDTIKSKSYSTNSSRSDRGDTAGSRVKSSSSGEKTVSTIVTSRSGESPPFDDNEHSVALREPLMDDDMF